MEKILIVEDDRALSNGIVLALKNPEYEFQQCFDLTAAIRCVDKDTTNLIILDINLPDGNGYDFLKKLRKNSDTPVLILTANDMEMDEVMGLQLGADDYMTKPFSLMVLRARIDSLLRRVNKGIRNYYEIDKFIFNFDAMNFKKAQQEIVLSKTEQKLLHVFVSNRGITLSRSVLVNKIWNDGAEYIDKNALSVTISRLRSKLEDNPAKPNYIQTVYGLGYLWRAGE